MADNFLSQDEVDALLKGVTGEVDEAPTEGSSAGIKPYDLGRQERIVRGRMPTLELFNERFARLFRIGLFNYMHRTAEIAVGPVRVQKYSEFVRNLVVPTNLNLVQMKQKTPDRRHQRRRGPRPHQSAGGPQRGPAGRAGHRPGAPLREHR